MGILSLVARLAAGAIHGDIARRGLDMVALVTEYEACGLPMTITDEQFATLRSLAESAGQKGRERFRTLARRLGREAWHYEGGLA